MSILSLHNVAYRYDFADHNALTKINATFERGRLYGIMGKSGSGKTTLLSLMAGFDKTTEGEILYQGINIESLNQDDYRGKNISVIPQSYNLLTNATAIQNLELAIEISRVNSKQKREKAIAILDRVGISHELAHRKILKLSGGEQQRVAIARALVQNSDIIIADEPTGNLDEETETQIMKILQSVARDENKCVIVVTHSRNVATYADEVLGMNNGKLVFVR